MRYFTSSTGKEPKLKLENKSRIGLNAYVQPENSRPQKTAPHWDLKQERHWWRMQSSKTIHGNHGNRIKSSPTPRSQVDVFLNSFSILASGDSRNLAVDGQAPSTSALFWILGSSTLLVDEGQPGTSFRTPRLRRVIANVVQRRVQHLLGFT